MTTESQLHRCEICDKNTPAGHFQKFFYGRRLNNNEPKAVQNQDVHIGGSRSVFICSDCYKKSFFMHPQMFVSILISVFIFLTVIVLIVLDATGVMPTEDDITIGLVLGAPLLVGFGFGILFGRIFFGDYFSFRNFSVLKAVDVHKKELESQGFTLFYSPQQYAEMLQLKQCQSDRGEKKDEKVSPSPMTDAPKLAEHGEAESATTPDVKEESKNVNICARCHSDSPELFYCKECGYTNLARSIVIVVMILAGIGLSIQGLASIFSGSTSLWIEVVKVLCCGGPAIIFVLLGIGEIKRKGDYIAWQKQHADEMGNLIGYYRQNPTSTLEETGAHMNRKPTWVDAWLSELEAEGKIVRKDDRVEVKD